MPIIEEIRFGESRLGIWMIDGSEKIPFQSEADNEIRHPRTRLQRSASRLLLAGMLGAHPNIQKDPNGRPLLPGLPWDVSISHTQGYASVLLGKGRLGVDVQHYKPNVMKVRDRFLDPEEMRLAKDLETATLLWTAKEAIYKFNGLPGLDFKGPIKIHSIETGRMRCSFIYKGIATRLLLGWKRLDGAMLSWTGREG